MGDVLREEKGIRVTAPWHGKHHPYAVYDGDELLCYCVYRKGAYALMDYILKLKQERKVA
jgi:hypothetical protein